jgi:hypothetical protein
MQDLYKESWRLYKHHTENFLDDLEYYRTFCLGKKSLELFAGFGRLTNILVQNGIDMETIELSPEFSNSINLPVSKKHVGDVTEVVLPRRFDRIFAAYNSFCLLTQDDQLYSFFENLSKMLSNFGQVSLSYYHPDYWGEAVPLQLVIDGITVEYEPSFDLSSRKEKKAVWRDKYLFQGKTIQHEYPVRIFDADSDLNRFLENSKLRIVDKVMNFNNSNVSEPGWVDYILSF